MDINSNTLQHKAAVPVSLKIANTKQPPESIGNGVEGGVKKTETRPESAGVSLVTEAKDTKNTDDLQQAVSKLNDYVQNIQRDLQFSIDKESGTMVVKVIDAKSEKVIRQIPNEETLRLARNLATKENEAAFNIFSSRA